MLRSLVLILLIVNAAFYAWSQGWLNQMVGVQPDGQHEPLRLKQQVQADRIVVMPVPKPVTAAVATKVAIVKAVPPPASAPSTPESSLCVEAGPFNPTEHSGLASTLNTLLPPGSWSSQTVAIQGLWLVYMGPYVDADMLERKQIELRRIKGLDFEEVRTPANLALGLSLGRYNRIEDAEAGLTVLRNRGIRTARIVNIRPNMDVQVVQVPHATADMQATLSGLKLPQGKGFTACRS
ncbi:MAG: hypothetical protein Q7U28_09615 [Aquabacterium sp.]|nr:hypothetical protein [Aquabacterium sp.]